MIALYKKSDFVRLGDSRQNPAAAERYPFSLHTSREYSKIIHSASFRRLQGKMQLFPPTESPLLRNRLTHSLEVADIAAKIVHHLNNKYISILHRNNTKIDVSIVTAAALAHDIGHPPFGHSGEEALNSFMRGAGSFEGNAQTLRLISKLENRFTTRNGDKPAYDDQKNKHNVTHSVRDVYRDPTGLNFLARTIAAIVKYDRKIELSLDEKYPPKGYYESESSVVKFVKNNVLGEKNMDRRLYTLECAIMDIADDIAYSTYDLEDCFISKELTPLDIISATEDTLELVAQSINKALLKESIGYRITNEIEVKSKDVVVILFKLFDSHMKFAEDSKYLLKESMMDRTSYVSFTNLESHLVGSNPLYRRKLTEGLIDRAIEDIYIDDWCEECPPLTRVRMRTRSRLIIEALKYLNYYTVIQSRKLQTYHSRATKIVSELCKELRNDSFNKMLPDEYRLFIDNYKRHGAEVFDYESMKLIKMASSKNYDGELVRMRAIADYVASLTDEEAVSVYAKMTSLDQRTIFGIGM